MVDIWAKLRRVKAKHRTYPYCHKLVRCLRIIHMGELKCRPFRITKSKFFAIKQRTVTGDSVTAAVCVDEIVTNFWGEITIKQYAGGRLIG